MKKKKASPKLKEKVPKHALVEINKPQYRYRDAFFRTFFDGYLYVDVAKRWKGIQIFYLFCLIFFLVLPFSTRVMADFNLFFRGIVLAPIATLPDITIKDGKLVSHEKMPHVVKNRAGIVLSVVDANATVEQLQKKYQEASIIIGKNEMLLRTQDPQVVVQNLLSGFWKHLPKEARLKPLPEKVFPPVRHFYLDKNLPAFEGSKFLTPFKITFLIILVDIMIYLMVFSLFFLMTILPLLVFSMMAQLVAKYVLKTPLNYFETCRLMMVSVTPALVFMFLLLSFDFFFVASGWIVFLMAIGYFTFAVLSVREKTTTLVRL